MEDTPVGGRNKPLDRGGKRSAVSGAGDAEEEGRTPLRRGVDAGRWGESRAEERLKIGLS